jgi:hypothetical protein
MKLNCQPPNITSLKFRKFPHRLKANRVLFDVFCATTSIITTQTLDKIPFYLISLILLNETTCKKQLWLFNKTRIRAYFYESSAANYSLINLLLSIPILKSPNKNKTKNQRKIISSDLKNVPYLRFDLKMNSLNCCCFER